MNLRPLQQLRSYAVELCSYAVEQAAFLYTAVPFAKLGHETCQHSVFIQTNGNIQHISDDFSTALHLQSGVCISILQEIDVLASLLYNHNMVQFYGAALIDSSPVLLLGTLQFYPIRGTSHAGAWFLTLPFQSHRRCSAAT